MCACVRACVRARTTVTREAVGFRTPPSPAPCFSAGCVARRRRAPLSPCTPRWQLHGSRHEPRGTRAAWLAGNIAPTDHRRAAARPKVGRATQEMTTRALYPLKQEHNMTDALTDAMLQMLRSAWWWRRAHTCPTRLVRHVFLPCTFRTTSPSLLDLPLVLCTVDCSNQRTVKIGNSSREVIVEPTWLFERGFDMEFGCKGTATRRCYGSVFRVLGDHPALAACAGAFASFIDSSVHCMLFTHTHTRTSTHTHARTTTVACSRNTMRGPRPLFARLTLITRHQH